MSAYRLVGNLKAVSAGTWLYDAAGCALGIIVDFKITQRRGGHEASDLVRGLDNGKGGNCNKEKYAERCRMAYSALGEVYIRSSAQPVPVEEVEIVERAKDAPSASAANVPAHGRLVSSEKGER